LVLYGHWRGNATVYLSLGERKVLRTAASKVLTASDDGLGHGKIAIAELRLTMPPIMLGDFVFRVHKKVA
jgi:hypothetical protein